MSYKSIFANKIKKTRRRYFRKSTQDWEETARGKNWLGHERKISSEDENQTFDN